MTLADVANAAAAAEAFALERAGADEEQALRVGLATDELGANALTHGGGAQSDLSLEIWYDEAFVHLTVSAAGPAFDPREVRRDEQAADEAGGYKAGGFGLTLVRQFVDAIDWRRESARNVTEISIRKRASPTSV